MVVDYTEIILPSEDKKINGGQNMSNRELTVISNTDSEYPEYTVGSKWIVNSALSAPASQSGYIFYEVNFDNGMRLSGYMQGGTWKDSAFFSNTASIPTGFRNVAYKLTPVGIPVGIGTPGIPGISSSPTLEKTKVATVNFWAKYGKIITWIIIIIIVLIILYYLFKYSKKKKASKSIGKII